MYHCYQEQPCLYDNTKVFQAERFFFYGYDRVMFMIQQTKRKRLT